MKTNHQRGFRAKSHSDNAMFMTVRVDPLSDTSHAASIGNDFSNGRRGEAKAKRGAKKYVTSRTRFHQKATVRELARDPDQCE